MDLELNEVDLCLFTSHEVNSLVTLRVEGGGIYTEIAEEFELERPQSKLRVAEEEEIVVVDCHWVDGVIPHGVCHLSADVEEKSISWLFGVFLDEGELGECAHDDAVANFDQYQQIGSPVDVFVEVGLILLSLVEFVDQSARNFVAAC